jgi:hypothetical protein
MSFPQNPSFDEKCDRILIALLSNRSYVIGGNRDGQLFICVGNDAVPSHNWNAWLEAKNDSSLNDLAIAQCPECHGQGVFELPPCIGFYSDPENPRIANCDLCSAKGQMLVRDGLRAIRAIRAI